jgi:hypothetical protein
LLPPSSKTDFLMYLPAISATAEPALSLPVSVVALQFGELICSI